MFQKLATYLTITLIILSALLWAAHTPQAHAIRRESARPVQGEILEGRTIIVNRFDSRGQAWAEVMEL